MLIYSAVFTFLRIICVRRPKMPFSKVPVTITDISELRHLPRRRTPTRVLLRLPMLSQEEEEEWQKRINSAVNACGCGEGAAFLLSALVLLGLSAIPLWSLVRTHLILSTMLSVAVVIGSVAAGKCFGKVRAIGRLRSCISSLRALQEARPAEHVIGSHVQSTILERGDLQ